MEYLNDIVINYVKNESLSPYALMITGAWGSGKTFYLKHTLKPIIENLEVKGEKQKVLYVSLNGISSFSEIYEQLLSEKFAVAKFFNEHKVGRIGLKIFKSASGILVNAAKIVTGVKHMEDIDPSKADLPTFAASELLNFSNCIIVFDDLERVSKKLNIEDVIGFINTNFVEHDNIKTIILSDESKIENAKFSIIKEKVIGRTVRFQPKIEIILKEHIDSLEGTDEGFKPFLKDNLPFILNRIDQAKIENLRTLFFFLDNLKQIHRAITPEMRRMLSEEIILSTLVFSNEYKLGTLDNYETEKDLPSFFLDTSRLYTRRFFEFDLEETKKTTQKDISYLEDKNRFTNFYGKLGSKDYLFIPPIFNFLKTGYLNSEELIKTLEQNIPDNISAEQDALNELGIPRVLHLAELDFQKKLNVLINGISNGEYSISQYLSGFYALVNLIDDKIISESDLKSICSNFNNDLETFFAENASKIKEEISANEISNMDIWTRRIASKNEHIFPLFTKACKETYEQLKNKNTIINSKERFNQFKDKIEFNSNELFRFYDIILLLPDDFASFVEGIIKEDSQRLNQFVEFIENYRWKDYFREDNYNKLQQILAAVFKKVDETAKSLDLSNSYIKKFQIQKLKVQLTKVIKEGNKFKNDMIPIGEKLKQTPLIEIKPPKP